MHMHALTVYIYRLMTLTNKLKRQAARASSDIIYHSDLRWFSKPTV